MTDLSPLSPVAQAVLKAACIHHGLFNEEIVQRRRMVAAALRAVADQLTFKDSLAGAVINPRELLDIAAELEGVQ